MVAKYITKIIMGRFLLSGCHYYFGESHYFSSVVVVKYISKNVPLSLVGIINNGTFLAMVVKYISKNVPLFLLYLVVGILFSGLREFSCQKFGTVPIPEPFVPG